MQWSVLKLVIFLHLYMFYYSFEKTNDRKKTESIILENTIIKIEIKINVDKIYYFSFSKKSQINSFVVEVFKRKHKVD